MEKKCISMILFIDQNKSQLYLIGEAACVIAEVRYPQRIIRVGQYHETYPACESDQDEQWHQKSPNEWQYTNDNHQDI